MSGYVPFNSPILAGLLMPNPTLAQSVFWQWLNQSHNACVNYANRNASKVQEKHKITMYSSLDILNNFLFLEKRNKHIH